MSSLDDDWARSIEAAEDAVHASRAAGTLPEAELQSESARIHEDRQWFAGARRWIQRLARSRETDD